MRIGALLLLPAAAAAATAGCGGRSNPSWLVTDLRVLAVRAQPPEANPGEVVTLDSLWADPHGGGRPVDHLWLACAGADGGPCTAAGMGMGSALPDGGALRGAPPTCAASPDAALCLVGDGPVVSYTVPADALRGVPAGGKSSVTFLLVTSALQGGATACVADWLAAGAPPADCVVATKSLAVSALPAAERNHDPTLAAITLDGNALPAAGGASIAAGGSHALLATWPPGTAEPEPAPGADGGTGGSETLLLSWFVTDGSLDHGHGDASDPGNQLVVPSSAEAVSLWVVIRDDRGGVGWLERQLFVGLQAPDGGTFDTGAGDAAVPRADR